MKRQQCNIFVIIYLCISLAAGSGLPRGLLVEIATKEKGTKISIIQLVSNLVTYQNNKLKQSLAIVI